MDSQCRARDGLGVYSLRFCERDTVRFLFMAPVKRDGEWIVRCFRMRENGELFRHQDGDYFTTDQEDAINTFNTMLAEAEKNWKDTYCCVGCGRLKTQCVGSSQACCNR